jgi:N-acetylneuraminic acid mutarotase
MLAAGLILFSFRPLSAQDESDAVVAMAPAPNTWLATSTVGAPAARDGHVAVWTGDRMIVWGGSGSDGSLLGDGAIYDPAARTWKPISRLGAPSSRTFATAVWTGNRMLVWGGLDHVGQGIGNGAAYDPVADTWSPITPAGAPSGRFFHTAVWTGTEMIVWGGFAGFVPGSPTTAFATGGAYDPGSDSWRATSRTGAPLPRGAHVAAWTGSGMIVWGGSSGHAAIAGGGIYDPVTESWTPTSTDGEPSGRVGHSGTWVGERFIVWGGLLDVGRSTNTGASYDPVTDSWTPIPLAGAPSARDSHAAAELGERLVIWSGESSGQKLTFLDDGAVFDPGTDTWTPASSTGAPSPRDLASVVSTGRSVIFWGGAGSVFFATGGEYSPPFCIPGDRHCVLEVPSEPPVLVETRP